MKLIKKILMGLGLLTVFSFVVSATLAYIEVNGEKSTGGTPTITDPRAEFMEGCTPDGLQNSYCQCMWREITNNYSVNELAKDGLSLTEEQLLEKYKKEIISCIDYYNHIDRT